MRNVLSAALTRAVREELIPRNVKTLTSPAPRPPLAHRTLENSGIT